MVTRRQLLGGGAAAVLGGAGYVGAAQLGVDVPGGARVRRRLGACGDDPGLPNPDADAEMTTGVLDGGYREHPAHWIVSMPAGATPEALDLVVVLHGSEGTARHAFDDNHGLDRFQMACIRAGAPPFALAVIDGGSTLWFDRDGGERPQSMVVDGFIPQLGELGFDIGRVALYGWGAGGFGVFSMADRLGADRVRAVGSLSPAIFPSWDFVDGYYVDRDEWERNDPRRLVGSLGGLPLRIDCGADDPFADEVERFRSEFDPPPPGEISAGCRDARYWHRLHPVMLDFLASRR